VIATQQFNAGAHYYDDVNFTSNQFINTAVGEGLWNLYH